MWLKLDFVCFVIFHHSSSHFCNCNSNLGSRDSTDLLLLYPDVYQWTLCHIRVQLIQFIILTFLLLILQISSKFVFAYFFRLISNGFFSTLQWTTSFFHSFLKNSMIYQFPIFLEPSKLHQEMCSTISTSKFFFKTSQDQPGYGDLFNFSQTVCITVPTFINI